MGARRALVVAALALAGCGGGNEREPIPQPSSPDTINFSTPDFKDGQAIPAELTCDGAGREPTIVWRAIPPETIELVMVVDDPDAPDGHVHALDRLRPDRRDRERPRTEGQFPAGALNGQELRRQGRLDAALSARGRSHRYVFTMYALGEASGLQAGAEPDAVSKAVEGALAHGRFTGTTSALADRAACTRALGSATSPAA